MTTKASRRSPSGDRLRGLSLLQRSHTPAPAGPDQAALEVFTNLYADRDYEITFDCPEFTSVCPVTGQPDFGRIVIRYVPDKTCVESKSLKLFLFAFRNHPTFHEEAVNRILDELVKACRPRRAEVIGEFRPRGGIALTVKAEHSAKRKGR